MAETQPRHKTTGEVYTPDFLVDSILDQASYTGTGILKKHVIDNSSGDGAFLKKFVSRYIEVALSEGMNYSDIHDDLETYIHGIELEKASVEQSILNLDSLVISLGLKEKVNWDILNTSTLKVTQFNSKMDFVIGNPPYVRVHNLNDSYEDVKKYKVAQGGMTDLYLVFYEIGMNMLNDAGVLTYISPSSWFTSVAGSILREELAKTRNLKEITDLGHFQPFEGITSYTAITTIDKNEHSKVLYSQLSEKGKYNEFDLDWQDFSIKGDFYFGNPDELSKLSKILNFGPTKQSIKFKNGFATLADKVFLNTETLKNKRFVIPVIKASTAEWREIIYPYNKDGKLIPIETFSKSEEYAVLVQSKEILSKTEPWYGFGRTQALNDTYRDKMSINSTVRDKTTIRLTDAPSGTGVYGGLYVVGFDDDTREKIRDIFVSDDFIKYVSLLKKYRRGGYYTFSSKDAQRYLDFNLEEADEQLRIY
jgi:adenine-specific DNA-methyltransferase